LKNIEYTPCGLGTKAVTNDEQLTVTVTNVTILWQMQNVAHSTFGG